MAKRGAYIAAGLAAFLVFLIAMVPASQVARHLPSGVALDGLSGTIWSGRAGAVRVAGRPLGALQWSCRPWRLVLLEWSCRIGLQPPGGEVNGDFSGDFAGNFVGRDIRGTAPISNFEGLATPRGWTGDLAVAIRGNAAEPLADGTVELTNAELRVAEPQIGISGSPCETTSRPSTMRATRADGNRPPFLSAICVRSGTCAFMIAASGPLPCAVRP